MNKCRRNAARKRRALRRCRYRYEWELGPIFYLDPETVTGIKQFLTLGNTL